MKENTRLNQTQINCVLSCTYLIPEALDQDSNVYDYTNRALDWMETCRDFDIPSLDKP